MRVGGALVARAGFRIFTLIALATTSGCLDDATSPNLASENETITLVAPADLETSVIATTGFTLSWTADETTPSGYQVEICLTSGCTTFVRLTNLTSLLSTSTSVEISELIPGFTYRVRLRSYDSTGVSAWVVSDDITTLGPPTRPAALVASAVTDTTLTLGWSDGSTDETGFRVQICTGAGCSDFSTDVATPASNVTSVGVTGLVAGTTYRFQIRAENTVGNSSWVMSDDITTYSIPGDPSGVAALAATLQSTSLILSWTDNSTNETGFTIQRCTGACVPSVTIGTAAAGATSYTDSSVSAETDYVYKVIATNPAGDCATPPTLAVSTPSTPVVPDGALTASATTDTTATLAWLDPADPVQEVAYEVSYKLAADSTWTVFSTAVAVDAAGTTVTGLTTGQSYDFRARRRSVSGDTSAWLTSVTTIYTLGVPAAPTAVTVLETSLTDDGAAGQARIVWQDSYDSSIAAIAPTSYTIAACSSTTSCTTSTHSSVIPEFIFNGLTPGTSYFFKVRGSNATGSSSWSANSINATPGNATNLLRTNGAVYASLQTGNTWILGGDFTLVGRDYGRGVLVHPSTPSASLWSSALQYRVNGTVNASVQDGSGYTYIGGLFSYVGSTAKANLARLTPSGELDTTFVTVTNGEVHSLALSSDGERLFVGGDFTSVTSSMPSTPTQNFFVLKLSDQTAYPMLDTGSVHTIDSGNDATSTLIPFAIAYTSESAGIDTFVMGGAGTVSDVLDAGAITLTGLVKVTFNQTTGDFVSFPLWCTAGVTGGGATVNALALSSSSVLLVGGDFTSACGTARNYLTVVNPSDASGTVSAVNPNPNGIVRAIALGASQVYLGGDFTTLYATARTGIGAFTLSGGGGAGALSSGWSADADDSVYSLAVYGGYVWAGGDFTTIGGSTRYSLAKLAESNAAVADEQVILSARPRTLSIQTGYLFVGGEFEIANGSERKNLAAIDTVSGDLKSLSLEMDGTVRALAVADQTLYVGGTFTTLGGSARAKIAAISLSDDSLSTWDPSPPTPSDISEVLSLRLSHRRQTLFVGGNFTNLGSNDVATEHIGILDLTSGEADEDFVVSGFGPAEKVRDMLPLETRVIVAGDFQDYSATYDGLIALSLVAGGTYGVLDAGWLPTPSNTSTFYSLDSSYDHTKVYAAGQCSDITANAVLTAGKNLYALLAADATVSHSFAGLNMTPATDTATVVRRSASHASSASTTPTETALVAGTVSGVLLVQELNVTTGVTVTTTPVTPPLGTAIYSLIPSGRRIGVTGNFTSLAGSIYSLTGNATLLQRSPGAFEVAP